MNASDSTGLAVELLLANYRLAGSICQIGESGRLGDHLSSRSLTITLKQASISDLRGQAMAALPELVVEKRLIIAAVPKESEDYQQRQRLVRLGMVTRPLVRVPILALIPPYAASGIAHIPPNSELSDPERIGLDRFFPLTNACLYLEKDRLYDRTVVIVNRDLVAALGKTGPEA